MNTDTMQNKKLGTCTYHSPIITKVTDLFWKAGLRIAFRSTNTVFRLLTMRQQCEDKYKTAGVYNLVCHTCGKSYEGQAGRCLSARYNEHIRYILSSNPKSAYVLHVLNIQHEYGPTGTTMDLMKPCKKGKRLNSGRIITSRSTK
jgi:hypothetical protein